MLSNLGFLKKNFQLLIKHLKAKNGLFLPQKPIWKCYWNKNATDLLRSGPAQHITTGGLNIRTSGGSIQKSLNSFCFENPDKDDD